MNPFECPICFELYDDVDHIPSTLPCGHSTCMGHLLILKSTECPICRDILPDSMVFRPNIALRDGSVEYCKLLKMKTTETKSKNEGGKNAAENPQFPSRKKLDTGISNVNKFREMFHSGFLRKKSPIPMKEHPVSSSSIIDLTVEAIDRTESKTPIDAPPFLPVSITPKANIAPTRRQKPDQVPIIQIEKMTLRKRKENS